MVFVCKIEGQIFLAQIFPQIDLFNNVVIYENASSQQITTALAGEQNCKYDVSHSTESDTMYGSNNGEILRFNLKILSL